MNCSTVSEPSLFEILDQNSSQEITISLLAEIERELLRVRADSSASDWDAFCNHFPNRRMFEILRLGTLTRNRLSNSSAEQQRTLPARAMHSVLSEAFQARPFSAPSPSHLVNAWEYSLPASRSLRARKAFFSREICEVLRTTVKPRVLILGNSLAETEHAIHSATLHHSEFVSLEDNPDTVKLLQARYSHKPLRVEPGSWFDLAALRPSLGRFDLIYSPAWLDQCNDCQSAAWLKEAVEMLHTGGKLLAANFAPGSRDAAWVEACWNWHPHYRSEEHLARLVVELKSVSVRGHAIFRDESGSSAFLEIHSL